VVSKDTIKQLLVENGEFALSVQMVNRNMSIEPTGNYVFTGPRRAGKSYLMISVIKQIVADGGTGKDFAFFRFEDERLAEMTSADLTRILEAHGELYGPGKPTVFLDEIQEIDGWEKYCRRLADNNYRVFVTGSNAKLLSTEIASALGGRYLTKEVYPYSLVEYLTANGLNLDTSSKFGQTGTQVNHLLADYLQWGGFPEFATYSNKRIWLESLYQKIFYGDIIVRHQIRNRQALRLLIKKLAESVSDEISANRMRNVLASTGLSIGKQTVIEYLDYLQESFFALPCTNVFKSMSEREQVKKYYFVDNGLLALFVADDKARLLENLVAIELHRRGVQLQFARDNREVDFFDQGSNMAIQVSYSLQDVETKAREISSLLKINQRLKAGKLLIITAEEDGQFEVEGTVIEVVSLKNWLLQDSIYIAQ
jgi:predicted AAA+ superfamily ATPase